MAAPHVAGVAALVLKAGIANGGNPATLHDDVKAHLCATTTVAGLAPTDPKYPNYYGCGIVNARKALIETPPPSPTNPSAPVAADDAASTAEDAFVDVDVLANDTDPNGDPLAVTGATDPAHGTTAVQPDGTVRYTPDPDYSGADEFDYTVDDGDGNTDSGSVAVTVSPVNDDPVANDDALVTLRNTSGNSVVLANDTDADDDALTVTGATSPAHGSATVEPDGSITYDPATGYDGPDGFDYTISDGFGGTATGHVAVTVVTVNQPPIAVDDSASVAEDDSAVVEILANDSDPDGGPLTATGVGAAGHGTTVLNPDGTVTYAPSPNYHGSDTFTYTIADGVGFTDTGAVTVTVTSVNDAPSAASDSKTTNEDVAATIDVVANDTDPDGDALTPIAVGGSPLGLVEIAANGTLVYTPPPNYFGTDSFTYTVADGNGGTADASVSVSIAALNDAPTASDQAVATNYGTAVTIRIHGADVETCNLTFQIVTPPAHGTLGSISNQICVTLLPPYADSAKLKYTPAAGWFGADAFTYRVSDGALWSAPKTVSVTTNDPVLLHVGDLDGSRTVQSNSWTAKVTIRVDNGAHGIVSGVTVAGVWSDGITGTATCKTTSTGLCTLQKGNIPKTTKNVTFTVTGMTFAPTGVYQPSANHDPEADSNGTVIVVFGP